MDKLLELILEYDMTKEEAKAWKVAIMYIDLANKYFPAYTHYRLGTRDPRKTSLFKHCYKLVREKDDQLANNEYKLYLNAQFQIMKNIDYGDGSAYIHPNCIVGAKAWNRWLLWKGKFYDRARAQPEPVTLNGATVVSELNKTKSFLMLKFSELKKENIIDILQSRVLFRWVAVGEVSGYYLVLSPIVTSWRERRNVDLLDLFAIDMNYYRKDVGPEAESYFRREFAYEF